MSERKTKLIPGELALGEGGDENPGGFRPWWTSRPYWTGEALMLTEGGSLYRSLKRVTLEFQSTEAGGRLRVQSKTRVSGEPKTLLYLDGRNKQPHGRWFRPVSTGGSAIDPDAVKLNYPDGWVAMPKNPGPALIITDMSREKFSFQWATVEIDKFGDMLYRTKWTGKTFSEEACPIIGSCLPSYPLSIRELENKFRLRISNTSPMFYSLQPDECCGCTIPNYPVSLTTAGPLCSACIDGYDERPPSSKPSVSVPIDIDGSVRETAEKEGAVMSQNSTPGELLEGTHSQSSEYFVQPWWTWWTQHPYWTGPTEVFDKDKNTRHRVWLTVHYAVHLHAIHLGSRHWYRPLLGAVEDVAMVEVGKFKHGWVAVPNWDGPALVAGRDEDGSSKHVVWRTTVRGRSFLLKRPGGDVGESLQALSYVNLPSGATRERLDRLRPDETTLSAVVGIAGMAFYRLPRECARCTDPAGTLMLTNRGPICENCLKNVTDSEANLPDIGETVVPTCEDVRSDVREIVEKATTDHASQIEAFKHQLDARISLIDRDTQGKLRRIESDLNATRSRFEGAIDSLKHARNEVGCEKSSDQRIERIHKTLRSHATKLDDLRKAVDELDEQLETEEEITTEAAGDSLGQSYEQQLAQLKLDLRNLLSRHDVLYERVINQEITLAKSVSRKLLPLQKAVSKHSKWLVELRDDAKATGVKTTLKPVVEPSVVSFDIGRSLRYLIASLVLVAAGAVPLVVSLFLADYPPLQFGWLETDGGFSVHIPAIPLCMATMYVLLALSSQSLPPVTLGRKEERKTEKQPATKPDVISLDVGKSLKVVTAAAAFLAMGATPLVISWWLSHYSLFQSGWLDLGNGHSVHGPAVPLCLISMYVFFRAADRLLPGLTFRIKRLLSEEIPKRPSYE